jgi:broad specificity phosphatase PhoE
MRREGRLFMNRARHEIQLVRHGESQANAGWAAEDARSPALTERGVAQARRVAQALSPKPGLIVQSDTVRSEQTADQIAAHHPNAQRVEWPIHEFTPLGHDAYQGTTVAQRGKESRSYWASSEPWALAGPGAESFGQLIERARSTLERLKQKPTENVVLVSHRKFITALVWISLTNDSRVSRRRMQRYRAFDQALRLPNASIIRLYWDADHSWIGSIERFDHVDA